MYAPLIHSPCSLYDIYPVEIRICVEYEGENDMNKLPLGGIVYEDSAENVKIGGFIPSKLNRTVLRKARKWCTKDLATEYISHSHS